MIDHKSETSGFNYYDTSLRDLAGPNRTFKGISNTGSNRPINNEPIVLKLDSSPIGLEKLSSSTRLRKYGLYSAGTAFHGLFIVYAGSSLYFSAHQISDILLARESAMSMRDFTSTQFWSLGGMLASEVFAENIVAKARRMRSR